MYAYHWYSSFLIIKGYLVAEVIFRVGLRWLKGGGMCYPVCGMVVIECVCIPLIQQFLNYQRLFSGGTFRVGLELLKGGDMCYPVCGMVAIECVCIPLIQQFLNYQRLFSGGSDFKGGSGIIERGWYVLSCLCYGGNRMCMHTTDTAVS